MSEKSYSIKTIIIAILFLIIIGMFFQLMRYRQGAGSLTIKTGNSELKINFAENKLNFSELIRVLLEGENGKDTLAILRDSYGLYKSDSDLLVDHIRKAEGNSSFSEQLRELLIDLKGPFIRKHHSYYDITKKETVDAINALGYNHKVCKEFRQLQDHFKGIFKPRGLNVSVTFASENQIQHGDAFVCQGSTLRGRSLLLLNQNDLNKTLSVFARDNLICLTTGNENVSPIPIIQITPYDGRKLFGDKVFHPKEKAVLFPSPKGYTIAPIIVSQ